MSLASEEEISSCLMLSGDLVSRYTEQSGDLVSVIYYVRPQVLCVGRYHIVDNGAELFFSFIYLYRQAHRAESGSYLGL